MDTTYEEADNIIVQQMLMVAKEEPSGITVLSGDIDVFVLLLHYYLNDGLKIMVTIRSPIKDRVVNIGLTMEKHK